MASKNDPMDIFVTGYPKSGNTWLARLLGECLDSPVTGFKNANPLCTEGLDRTGKYVIRQLHLRPVSKDDPKRDAAIDNAYRYDWRHRLDGRIVHIVRDVRDVIVSAHFYWQRKDISETVNAVCNGEHPLRTIGPWQDFVESWFSCPAYVPPIKYEALSVDAIGVMLGLFREIEIEDVLLGKIKEAVNAQSFARTRARIEKDGDSRPYGKTIQLRNLRRGFPGDWRNHLTMPDCRYIHEKCGPLLMALGYIQDNDWWKIGGPPK